MLHIDKRINPVTFINIYVPKSTQIYTAKIIRPKGRERPQSNKVRDFNTSLSSIDK